MTDKEYNELKRINYYKEIIKNLREEIKGLISENEALRERIRDLEIINEGHQELVGTLIEENKKIMNGRNK